MLKLASCNDFVRLKGLYPKLFAGYGFEWSLKEFGSLFIYDHIIQSQEKVILEFGPGFNLFFTSKLPADAEYWSIDDSGSKLGIGEESKRFESVVRQREQNGHRHVHGLLGDDSKVIPDDHFDTVFSISVIEHIPGDVMENVAKEAFRVLKPGGTLINTVDIYYGSKKAVEWAAAVEKAGFKTPNAVQNNWAFGGLETTFLERSDVRYEIYNKLQHPDIWNENVPYVTQFATVCQKAVK
jgi:SAM-dependent methyltransferase